MDPSDAQASAVNGPSAGSKPPTGATAEAHPQHEPQQASSAEVKPDWDHLTDLMSDMGLNQLDHLSWADQCDTILGCGSDDDDDQSSGDDQPEALSGEEDSADEMPAADMPTDANDAAAAQQDQQQDDSAQLQQEPSDVDHSTTQHQQLGSITDESASEDLPQHHSLGLFTRSRRRMTCTGDDDEGCSSEDDAFSSQGPDDARKPAADLLLSRASAPPISRTISLASWLSSRQHASSHPSSSSGFESKLDAAPPSSHRARSILSLGFRQHQQLQQQGSSRAGSDDAGAAAAAAATTGAAAGNDACMQQAAAQAAAASQQSNKPVGLLTGKKLSRQPQPQAQAGSQASVPRGHKRSTRHRYQTEAAQLASLLEESEQDFSTKCAEVQQMKQQMMTLQEQLAAAQQQAQQASSAPRLSCATAESAISSSEAMLAAHRELMSQQLQLFEAWQAADGEASQMRLQMSELRSQHDDAMAAALKMQHDLLASNTDLMQRLQSLEASADADADATAGQQAEAQQSTTHTHPAADGGPHQGQQQRQELAALEAQHEAEVAALKEKLRQQEADASEALADERKAQQRKLASQLAAAQQALKKKHQQELAQASQQHEQQQDAAIAAVRKLYEQQYAAKLQAVMQQQQEELEHQAAKLQQQHEAAQARIAGEAAQQRGAVQQQLKDLQAQLVTSRKRAIVAQNCLAARSDELQQEQAKHAGIQLELAEAVAAIARAASARGAAAQQLADAQQQAQEASDAMRRADIKAAGADLARASTEAARQGAEERCRVLQQQLTAEVAGAQAAREALSGLGQRHRQVEQQLEAQQESHQAALEGSSDRISQLSAQLAAAQDATVAAQQQLQQGAHREQELKAQHRRHTGRMLKQATQLLSEMFDKMNGAFSHAHAITAAHAASEMPPEDGGDLDDPLPSPVRRRAVKAQQLRHQQQRDAAALASWQQLQSTAGELLGEGGASCVAQIKQLQAVAMQVP